MAYDYEYFKKAVYELTKIDLNSYKEKQMKQKDINIGDKFGIYEVLGELQRTKTI